MYLKRCDEQSKSDDDIDIDHVIDINVYTELVQLDFKLGTTASNQLAEAFAFTTRSDIIKVQIFALNSIY